MNMDIAPLSENPQPPDDFKGWVIFIWKKVRLRVRFYFRKVLPPVTRERVSEVQMQLRDASAPDFDYFVMVLLSAAIASFGLLTDSVATIIGAMLVAPLMSPILGIGLASIRGDTNLLKDAASAVLRGALIAVVLSALVTWANELLPFVSVQELPAEVLSRTRPTPIDLGIALAGGLAATYALVQPGLSAAMPGVAIATALMPPLCAVGVGIALGEWDVAQGAFMLFLTNAITIAASATSLFYILGFSLARKATDRNLPRSVQVSLILTVLLLAYLAAQSYFFFQEANFSRTINQVARAQVEGRDGELTDLDWIEVEDILQINITIRVSEYLTHGASVEIQDALANELQRVVELNINQINVARLDPKSPPTPTPTLTVGPSPTPTITPTVTPTLTLTPTASPTPTDTPTPTVTPTPGLAVVTERNGVDLHQSPGGPVIGRILRGETFRVLYGYEIVGGWVWIEIQDQEGRIGWVPQYLTQLITATPTPTAVEVP
jgi:uncharacterized hydrophobic protein (TIGR00271 family)